VGACRHRAYAFVLTLQALGLPSRYVGNEAHAWAEAWIPGSGWSRIDLGGWDIPFDAAAPSERAQFHPDNTDPFPQPAQYTSQYSSRVSSSPTTGGVSQAIDPSASRSHANTGGTGATPDDGRTPASSTSSSGPATAPSASTSAGPAGTSGGSAPGRGISLPVVPPPTGDDSRDDLGRTSLQLATVQADAPGSGGYPTEREHGLVRGSMVRVNGAVHDERGAPLGGLTVQIELLRDGHVAQSLGTTVSQPDGRWDARVLLPGTLDTGEYTLRVQTPGDSRHSAAAAE
jgi:hypothetical protein